MFSVKNISKKYNNEVALKDVSLNINKGINFIVGPSGSGKTTLLKIISGLECNDSGEVLYKNSNVHSLKNSEKSFLYNNDFGFVWQNFNLIEDATVTENILLPALLKNNSDKDVLRILETINILDLKEKKVKNLSSGQKQRVAIARELAKNPKIIITDEPTGALDEKNAKVIMELLRTLAKTKIVIIVTHDTSLIMPKDNVFEFDKGELISSPTNNLSKGLQFKDNDFTNLNNIAFKNSIYLTKTNIKNKLLSFFISSIAILLAGCLLLISLSGVIVKSGEDEFNKLIETYGEGILDISLVGSFMSASGTDNGDKDEPNADVDQDISGLYNKYDGDARIKFLLFIQAFNDISINVDNKNYTIQTTGTVPTINKLLEGNMPQNSKDEVIVPKSFVKKLGISNGDAIGREIEFFASVYDWSTGSPVLKDVNTKAKIVGVFDETASYEFEGEKKEMSVEDSFFFSKSIIDKIRKQAAITSDKINFQIRANNPEDMISLKDELNEAGIVPLGQFELVEDMVRLNNQTSDQSGFAGTIIAILSVIMILAIFFIICVLKKKEYAIYKVCGFSNKHFVMINIYETVAILVTSFVLLLSFSWLINIFTVQVFNVDILNLKMISTISMFLLIISIFTYFINLTVYIKVNITKAFKTGDR